MASPIGASVQSSYLKCTFLGDTNGIRVSGVSTPRVGGVRKVVECKESRIGKQPITVPSNVTLTRWPRFESERPARGACSYLSMRNHA